MNNLFQNINRFFEEIKIITFWQRIFGWTRLRKLSYDAYEEFKKIFQELDDMSGKLSKEQNNTALLNKDIERLMAADEKLKRIEEELIKKQDEFSILNAKSSAQNTTIESVSIQLKKKEEEIKDLKARTDVQNAKMDEITKENIKFKQTEESRSREYEKKVTELNTISARLESDRQKISKEREEEIITRFEKMKQTWSKHEFAVESAIREICRKHTIEYIDKEKVPFKGKPDNTIKICDEYVIFDAKSPANEDLQNFPNYIKLQTESVKKYIKEENIKKDIFLVIPSNTAEVIKQFTHNLADYTVFVVTENALEPIILSLKKIEEYEFAEKLSPEERDSICRVIGKFAHTTKRKIQIDYFFSQEFLSILSKCKADLPREILEKVIEYEKSEKLNPPIERRAKPILISDLEKDSAKIQKEAGANDIVFPADIPAKIKDLPLYGESEGK